MRYLELQNLFEQVLDLPGAVHERILTDPDEIEQSEVEVSQVRSFFELDMPAALQASCSAARYQDRQVFMIVEAGVAHAAAVQVDRVIEERPVAVGRGFHFLEEI